MQYSNPLLLCLLSKVGNLSSNIHILRLTSYSSQMAKNESLETYSLEKYSLEKYSLDK